MTEQKSPPPSANPEAAAYNMQGISLYEKGDLVAAEVAFRQALALHEPYAEAHNNLGIVLRMSGRMAEAHRAFMRSLALRPNYAEAMNNLGHLYRVDNRIREARALFERAIELKPDYAQAYNNIGMMLGALGQFDEAEVYVRKAIDLMPGFAGAHNNLAVIHQAHGRLEAAIASYTVATILKPDYVEAHSNLSLCLLAAGRFREGWKKQEIRWKVPHLHKSHRFTDLPLWQGQPLDGKRILLHAEQGYGDTLQFCRYIPMVEALGAKVIVDVPVPLVRLMHRFARIEQVITFGRTDVSKIPRPDFQCPLMSLPLVFGTELETIPATIPYLDVHPIQQTLWREKLLPYADKRMIGIAWAGNPRKHSAELSAVDRRRSMAPEVLLPLLDAPNTQFFSLQKDAPPHGLNIVDFTPELCDFADTAALMMGLDLIISVDTAVVHLAGALGKPVWLLSRYDNCWRWLKGRSDSPWYPTLRMFRQPTPGDWDSVIADVNGELRKAGV